MTQAMEGNSYLWFLVLVFISAVLLIEGLYLLWSSYKGPQATKVRKRLQALSAGNGASPDVKVFRQRLVSAVPLFERLLLQNRNTQRVERWIFQAGLEWTISRLVLSCAVLGLVACFVVTTFLHQLLSVGIMAALAAAALPIVFVNYRRHRRFLKFERQLPDAIDLLTRALRSGSTFAAGLHMVSTEMNDPIAKEFGIVHDEVNFGVSMQQALGNLTMRIPGTDLRYFAVAVMIQREAGGNLTEILGNLSGLIRERLKLMSKIRVLSSDGRLSALFLVSMPFALGGLFTIFNPEFMRPLWTDPLGISIIKTLLIMMAFGVLVMRKIIRIRV